MSAETRKVLELLAERKITSEDAEKLLDKLTATPSGQNAANGKAETESAARPKKQRYLRILVERPGQDHVNLRVPLSFARTGTRLLAVLPPKVSEKLAEHGIDMSALAALKMDELAEAVENTHIEIDKGNGKKVRIFCE